MQWTLGSPNHWTIAPKDTPEGALERGTWPGADTRRGGWEGLRACRQKAAALINEGRTDRWKEGPDVQDCGSYPLGSIRPFLTETLPVYGFI